MACDPFSPDDEIGDRGADLVGRAVGGAGDVLDAGFALHDDVVAGTVLLRPVLPNPEIEQYTMAGRRALTAA